MEVEAGLRSLLPSLIFSEPPSAPTEVRAAKIASRTVEIMWSPSYNGNSPIRKYHVHFTNTTSTHLPTYRLLDVKYIMLSMRDIDIPT